MVSSIAHIVNPVAVDRTSDLYVAQPVTFETMRRARQWSERQLRVEQFCAEYPEDRSVVPTGFRCTRGLERSVLDFGTFQSAKQLPLISDILTRLYEETDAELLVYSNVDIAVVPNFYESLAMLVERGHDALVINRRTIFPAAVGTDALPLMYMDVGMRHPGRDCFAFRRELFEKFILGHVVVGAPWVGSVVQWNMAAFAEAFSWIKDAHLTFHIGDDQTWASRSDHERFNRAEALSVLRSLQVCLGEASFSERVMPYVPEGRMLRGRRPGVKTRAKQKVKRRLRTFVGCG